MSSSANAGLQPNQRFSHYLNLMTSVCNPYPLACFPISILGVLSVAISTSIPIFRKFCSH